MSKKAQGFAEMQKETKRRLRNTVIIVMSCILVVKFCFVHLQLLNECLLPPVPLFHKIYSEPQTL